MCTAVIVPIVRTIGAIHVSVVRRGTANAPVTSTDRYVSSTKKCLKSAQASLKRVALLLVQWR